MKYPTISPDMIKENYSRAVATYRAWGVDADKARKLMVEKQVSLHCWQGDDVAGFEGSAGLDGGIAVTGNYPGRARNWNELKADLEETLALIPGKHRVNVHALYQNGPRAPREKIGPEQFRPWIDWAKGRGVGLDFNGSFFSHPMASSGYTLSHADATVRKFWIEHGKRSRDIGEAMGKELGSPAVVNVWIPDGSKDLPADRLSPRKRLKDSLDEVFAAQKNPAHLKDAVECKLFGIGSESYVVGSHEFYLGYALKNGVMPCFDMGHFHPTESIADKISSTLLWAPELLLHVSRGVRWDSDHVVTLGDELKLLTEEITRCEAWGRVNFALDYFDASINRIAAWSIGARSAQKAILLSFLEPIAMLREAESAGNNGARLALLEGIKTLPFGAVWDMACLEAGVPVDGQIPERVGKYEGEVLSKRK